MFVWKSLFVCICMWQCDLVIHYTSAFAWVCGVELIKPIETLGLGRASAASLFPPLLGCTLINLAINTQMKKEQGHFIGFQMKAFPF